MGNFGLIQSRNKRGYTLQNTEGELLNIKGRHISKGIGGVIMQDERTIIDNRKLDLEWWGDGKIEGEIEKGDGIVHHVVCHGSRRHVLYWDSNGEHCKEPRCEINRKKED